MRKTISEVAKQAGVSVRTLHYYDELGLLTPSEVTTDTGYRYYDENDITKLQQILFYRELDFSLKEIKTIMNSSDYDMSKALKQQRKLLMLKRQRLDEIIALLDANLKGEKTMSLKEFDMKEINDAKA